MYVLELPLSLVTVISWSVFVSVRVTKPVPVIVTLELVGVTLILYLSNPSSTYIVCSNKSLSKDVRVLPLMEMLSKVVTELFVVGKLTVLACLSRLGYRTRMVHQVSSCLCMHYKHLLIRLLVLGY